MAEKNILIKMDNRAGSYDNFYPVTKGKNVVLTGGQNAEDVIFASESKGNKGVANGYAGLDGNGKVPAAQLPAVVASDWATLNNKPTSTVANIDDAVAKKHTHANQIILDATTASYTTALDTKLAAAATATNLTATDNKIGTLSTLLTTNKTNLVSATNELFQSVSSGKDKIATVLLTKGISASGSDTFDQLSTKIGSIIKAKGNVPDTKYVVNGYHFSNDNGEYVGSMQNYGGKEVLANIIPVDGKIYVNVAEGYYDTGSILTSGLDEENILQQNIKKDVYVLGIRGTYVGEHSTGNASTSDVLEGQGFDSELGKGMHGTMPNLAGQDLNPVSTNLDPYDGTFTMYPHTGYHDAVSNYMMTLDNLEPQNVKKGVVIKSGASSSSGGVVGTYEGSGGGAIKTYTDCIVLGHWDDPNPSFDLGFVPKTFNMSISSYIEMDADAGIGRMDWFSTVVIDIANAGAGSAVYYVDVNYVEFGKVGVGNAVNSMYLVSIVGNTIKVRTGIDGEIGWHETIGVTVSATG